MFLSEKSNFVGMAFYTAVYWWKYSGICFAWNKAINQLCCDCSYLVALQIFILGYRFFIFSTFWCVVFIKSCKCDPYSLCNIFDGLVQDCSISIANALEILWSCTKPLILECAVRRPVCFTDTLSFQNYQHISTGIKLMASQFPDIFKFKCILSEWKSLLFGSNFTEVCSNWQ